MANIKIAAKDWNFFVLTGDGYSKSEPRKYDVIRAERKDSGASLSPQSAPDTKVFYVVDIEETDEDKYLSIRPYSRLEMLKGLGQMADEETDKMSIRDLFIQKGGMDPDEYDDWSEKAKAAWRRFINALERREMSYSGAASTITHEHKNLRYLKNIHEQLDSIKTIMKAFVDAKLDEEGRILP